MAKKVFITDKDNGQVLPITRGECVYVNNGTKDEVLDDVLYPYSASVSGQAKAGNNNVGTTQLIPISLSPTSITLTAYGKIGKLGTTATSNVALKSVTAKFGTIAVTMTVSGTSSTGTATFTAPTMANTPDNTAVTVTAAVTSQTNKTANASATMYYIKPSYVGVLDEATAPNATNVAALTVRNSERVKGMNTTFTADNKCPVYAYPASRGNLTSIKDPNNFEMIQNFTKTTVTINEEPYNVYKLTKATTVSNYKFTFA